MLYSSLSPENEDYSPVNVQLNFPVSSMPGQQDGQCFIFFPVNDNCVEFAEMVRLKALIPNVMLTQGSGELTYINILDDDGKGSGGRKGRKGGEGMGKEGGRREGEGKGGRGGGRGRREGRREGERGREGGRGRRDGKGGKEKGGREGGVR